MALTATAILGTGVAGNPAGGSAFQREDVEAADRQLVAVAQLLPLDPLAVDEDAVEAAVVEHAQPPAGLRDDQRVAPRDARVVEAQVGGDAAPDARPAALDPE